MDKTTVIVVVLVVLVIAVVMYTSSQQAAKDRELQMQLASMQNQTAPSNFWSSLGDIGSLAGTLGGLFNIGGSGTTTATAPISARTTSRLDNGMIINSSTDEPYELSEYATNGLDYLRANVEDDCGCMEFNE